MSISGALSNALSGLTAAARGSEIVSSNLSNATNEAYGPRELQLSSRTLGGGVSIDGVARRVDPQLLADRRSAEASLEATSVRSDFFARLSGEIGEPGTDGSLTDRIAAFESALTYATSRPDSHARLAAVHDTAENVARKFNAISRTVQTERERADAEIGREVRSLNRSLKRVADINDRILAARGSQRGTSSLLDERRKVIDAIATSVPVRVLDRGSGTVALMSEGGALLVDGSAVTLDFDAAGSIPPERPQTALSSITTGEGTDKRDIRGDLSGGKLEALFEKRDNIAAAQQEKLDALAFDLVKRFEEAESAGASQGLFTDAGKSSDPNAVVGLADRIAANAATDPATGDPWKLRAGLDAGQPGPAGDRSHLQDLSKALTKSTSPAEFGQVSRSAAGLAGEFVSGVGTDRQNARADHSFHQARTDSLRARELENGVDTDQELQKLLTIERAYAANARVIQTADTMIQRILEI